MTYFPFMAHAFAQMRQWRHYAPSGSIAEGVPVLQVLSGALFNPKISSILRKRRRLQRTKDARYWASTRRTATSALTPEIATISRISDAIP